MNKTKEKIDKKQQRLDNSRKYKLVFDKDVKITCLADIIYYLMFVNIETFWKKSDGKLIKQITGNCRSIEDCYLISKNYIPNITLSDVINAVEANYSKYVEDSSEKLMCLHYHWCHDIRKKVHYKMGIVTDNTLNIIKKKLNDKNLNLKAK